MQQNHYKLLDVPFSATRKDITTAYHKQMRKWHPDRFRGTDKTLAENYAKDLNHAYSVLSDPRKREEYDRALRIDAIQGQIMERYVAGSSGWNLDGKGPLPADAPRRNMTARERSEQRITDRNANRAMVMTFAMFTIGGLLLLLLFSLINSTISAIF